MDMNALRTRWWVIKMSLFHKLGMQTRIRHLYLDGEIEKKYSIGKLKRVVSNDIIPHNKRMAAIRLYDLGERDFAIAFLIDQMNLYAKPDTPANTKNETCVHTAMALGRIKDKRAITHLLSALGELPFFGASYALSLINGNEVTAELVKMAALENKKGLHAIIALGFMTNSTALPYLLEIHKHRQEYDQQYLKVSSTSLLTHFTYRIIGLYDDNSAKAIFLSNLTKDSVGYLLNNYVQFARYPRAYTVGNDVGWHITKKYGWDKYVNSERAEFAFLFAHLSSWTNYFKTACPFTSQNEVDTLREDIKNKIWKDLGN